MNDRATGDTFAPLPRAARDRLDELAREVFEDAGLVIDTWAIVAIVDTQHVDAVVVATSPRPYVPNRATLAGMLGLAANLAHRTNAPA